MEPNDAGTQLMRPTEKSKLESQEQAQRKNHLALTREEMTPLREWLPFMEKRVAKIAGRLHAPLDGSLNALFRRERTAI